MNQILPTSADIAAAAEQVYRIMPPTPQYCWPLLGRLTGAEIWVKHENHSPIGAFKVRGGLTFMAALRRERPDVTGVVSATRGNHGQSIALAATHFGLKATIVVPHGNSREKNAAMAALGAELIEHGHDFQAAAEHAAALEHQGRLFRVPSFHPWLVRGVATYGWELLNAVPTLDTIYVPIGLGSGICGVIAAREALGSKTEIVGVVAELAPTYALSFAAGRPTPTNSADTFADGLAVRVPDPQALDILRRHAARIVTVGESEIKAAICDYFSATHNVAEGAGAAALAAAMQERGRLQGKRVGLILSGGNIDRTVLAPILAQTDI